MVEQLFGSNTRFRLLRFFFLKPDKPYYVRQLARLLEVQINAIRRELEILMGIGLLQEVTPKEDDVTRKIGSPKRKYYLLNPDCIIYPEMQALFEKENAIGREDFVRDMCEKAGDIKFFLLTGRFTGYTKASTDLLLVGEIKPRILMNLITQYEKDFGHELRYTIMTEKEFIERRYVMDKFIYTLFEGPHLKLVDKIGNGK